MRRESGTYATTEIADANSRRPGKFYGCARLAKEGLWLCDTGGGTARRRPKPRPTDMLVEIVLMRAIGVQAIMAGEAEIHEHLRVPSSCDFRRSRRMRGPYVDANNSPTALAAAEARDTAITGAQAAAFEGGVPSARVVRLPHASHSLFISNEADVLREIRSS